MIVGVVVPGPVVRPSRRGFPASFDDDELTHHPAVLVLEDVPVEHVGEVGVGVVLEPSQQPTVSPGGT